MSISIKYFLFIATMHIVLTILVFSLLKDQPILFIVSEFFILLSIYLSYRLYQSFIRPISLMQTGVNALKDQDFNVKFLSQTQSREINDLIDVFNQLIERLREERTQMEAQNYFLQNLIQVSPSGIIIFDYDQQITQINPQAKAFCQLPTDWNSQQAANSPLLDAIHQLPIGASKVLDIDGLKKYKCQASTFIHKGFARKFVLIEELSNELLAAEKKAYGKVIRMMAHEVNNSIGAINSILDSVIEFGFPDPNKDQDLSDSLKVAMNRNDKLNEFMRNFAEVIRLPQPHLSSIDLNKVINNTIKLLRPRLDAQQIELSFDSTHTPFYIQADEIQLEQVLVNIIKNSLEASEQGSNISIQLKAQERKLYIIDNGTGISEAVAKQLFSPFFSTKADGQGIGLILIREILNNHQFDFSLKNRNSDKGAVFSIAF